MYAYDPAGNRTLAQTGVTPSTGTFNSLNQLTALQAGGAGQLGVIASINKPVTNATINGAPASVAYTSTAGTLQGVVPVQSGSNPLTIIATDSANGQPATKSYNVQVPAAANRTPTYDLNDETSSDGQTRTHQWDAADRLSSILYTGTTNHTDFTYDALGRYVKLVEMTGTAVVQTRQFVWTGVNLAEELDASNQVVRRYFGLGEQIVSGTGSGTLLYYTRDHLDSVREAVDGSGSIRARYDYDPYGQSSLNQMTTAALEVTFKYAGYMQHPASGLALTINRSYDPALGRWSGRDPIAERSGLNLYRYVRNRPVNLVDSLGLYEEGEEEPPFETRDPFEVRAEDAQENLRRIANGGELPRDAYGNEIPILRATEPSLGDKIGKIADAVLDWLGLGCKPAAGNANSDLMLQSADGTRAIRFDLTDPHGDPGGPHIN